MSKLMKTLSRDQSGTTAVEYGLIAALIGVAMIVGLQALEEGLTGLFNNIAGQL